MQENSGVAVLLKVDGVVLGKTKIFQIVSKKSLKKPDPIHFHKTCFYHTGICSIIVCVNILSIGCI